MAGAPPRTSPLPTVPAGNSTTVTPVPVPVQCPARTPGTGSTTHGVDTDLTREVDDQLVERVGALEHQHVAAVGHELESRIRDRLGDLLR